MPRQADRDLYESLLQGQFCYVLHARQMGKSSLMVQTTARLRKAGVAVAAFELTALGQNLTVEQWYDGLLARIGRNLDLEDALEECWLEHERFAPLQRFMEALREVVLRRCPGPIVLCLDEIDAVRSLPFSTDEFFAAIRECYNRRSQDPEWGRLTFCLLGVATPSDLIQDTRTTPFNIGKRIELTDFTAAEAAPLAQGLGSDAKTRQALLQRVLSWTGGHPYLTQRLCQAVADDATAAPNPQSAIRNPQSVDRHCEALFLSPQAQERDDNLLFVRERLLKSEADRASLLELYGQVRSGKRVRLNDTNQLVSLLRLAGITRVAEGTLRVRNRIYARVFDREWVLQHMPDAELRRQQVAYRRGLMRASAIASVVVAVMAGLVLVAVTQAHRANQQRHMANQQRQMAVAQRLEARRNLYAAQMNLAQQDWEVGDVGRAMQLVEAQRPAPGQEDLRGFEWRCLWRRCQDESRVTLRGHTGWVPSVAISPDGKTLASAGSDQTIRLWEIPSGREMAVLRGHSGQILGVAWSPDGRTLASSGMDRTVRLWHVAHRRELAILRGHRARVDAVVFSPDGKTLASGSQDRTVRLWDVSRRRQLTTFRGNLEWVTSMAFSSAGDLLAVGSAGRDNSVHLWNLRRRREAAVLRGNTGYVLSVAISPDGKTLASAGPDTIVKLWDLRTKKVRMSLRGHQAGLYQVAFSPVGRTLASCSADHTARLWDTATGEMTILRGHRNDVTSVSFSPDGRTLAFSTANVVKLWNLIIMQEVATLRGHTSEVYPLAFSHDGTLLASAGGDTTVRLWRAAPPSGTLLPTGSPTAPVPR